MIGIVRREQHAQPALRQGADFAHDLALIAEVEACRRLVEHDETRFLCQRAGEQDELALAARDLRIGARREMRDAEARERGICRCNVARARSREQAQMRAASHQHDGLDRKRKRACVHLRDIADGARPLGDRCHASGSLAFGKNSSWPLTLYPAMAFWPSGEIR
jgi:hypothetical protein